MRIIYPGETRKGKKREKPFKKKWRPSLPRPSLPRIKINSTYVWLGAFLLLLLSIPSEINYQYYAYKGRFPTPLGDIYPLFPDIVRSLAREGARQWAALTDRPVPVTTLPDHVMLCISKSLTRQWNNPPPGSMEGRFKNDVEDLARSIAKRHTKPGISYDENDNHVSVDDGSWIIYADPQWLNRYRNGQFNPEMYNLFQYVGTGSNHICVSTTGHKDGPENYIGYAYTFNGEKILWRE